MKGNFLPTRAVASEALTRVQALYAIEARARGKPPSEVRTWIDEAKRGMENALCTNPLDIQEQYEKQIKYNLKSRKNNP